MRPERVHVVGGLLGAILVNTVPACGGAAHETASPTDSSGGGSTMGGSPGSGGDGGRIEPLGGSAGRSDQGGTGGSSSPGGKGGAQVSGGGGGLGAAGGTGGLAATGGVTGGVAGSWGGSGGAGGGGTGAGGTSGGGTGGGGTSDGGTGDGGTGGAVGDSGGTGGDSTTACEFDITASLGPKTRTVGVVEWSVDLDDVQSAEIEFGLDGYPFSAPVDLDEPNYRTLLLGMKADSDYQFRIVARSGDRTCISEPQVFSTYFLVAGLPVVLSSVGEEDYDRGFTIVCEYAIGGLGGESSTLIIDADGDIVWSYWMDHADCTHARMSFDGKHMWMANGNINPGNQGVLTRVTMDCEQEESFELPYRHHDIAVLPDGKVAYIEYEGGDAEGCDVIKELDPVTGTSETIFSVADANPNGAGSCQSTALNYWPDHGLYTVAVSGWNSIVAFDRAGELAWVFGGSASDFAGPAFEQPYNHHLLDDSLLLFANGDTVLEYRLEQGSAPLVWEYTSELDSTVLGDVHRLPNGNTLVGYATSNVIAEVTPDGQLARELEVGAMSVLGYVVRRATLYGPPPPY